MIIVDSGDERERRGWGESTSIISHRLLDAVYANDITQAQQLIASGANVNETFEGPGYANEPCLIAAIFEENLEMVELLLKNGADTYGRGDDGFTPLANAITTGKLELVKILLDYGADIDCPSGMCGETPLLNAVIENQPVIFRYLLRRGADPNAKDYNNNNASGYVKDPYWAMPPE